MTQEQTLERSPRVSRGILLHGDCLSRLAELVSGPQQRFDLVYVDPPFNAGGTRGARRNKGERIHGPKAYRDHWGGIDAFISMLRPRLAAVRDVMSDSASLWLHLDHRTVHDAKVLADQIFGRSCFQGEVIWVPGNGGRRRSGPSVTHQTLLIFSRTKDFIYNIDDPALREPYATTSLKMHFQRTDAQGRHYRERVIAGKTYRYYADAGRRLGSVWQDCPAMRANTPLTAETTGYPTQKPESLLERIVRAASVPTSRVLDPMCGSGTTLVAAGKLGRHFAGVDESSLACEIAHQRLSALNIECELN